NTPETPPNLPAIGEGVVEFLPRYPLRALGSRFLVTKTHQEHSAARLDHPRQPLDVAPPVVVGEDVEQPAVDHAAEALAPVAQRCRILDQELYRQAPLGRLDPGPPDRLVQEVDAGDPVAPGGEEQGGVARAAAGVEDRAGDPISDRDERPLWFADVPG